MFDAQSKFIYVTSLNKNVAQRLRDTRCCTFSLSVNNDSWQTYTPHLLGIDGRPTSYTSS